jgi:hypothetical protein
LREETGRNSLSDGLVGVAGSMQPKHITLWLSCKTSSKEKRTD